MSALRVVIDDAGTDAWARNQAWRQVNMWVDNMWQVNMRVANMCQVNMRVANMSCQVNTSKTKVGSRRRMVNPHLEPTPRASTAEDFHS